MSTFATTKLSSKGQIVIPEEIRDGMGLREGTQFVVFGQGDTVILRTITPPRLDELRPLLAKSRQYAKKSRLKKSDVKKAVAKVRTEK